MKKGFVSLVGAGPGDAELMTVKALRLLQEADVVVFDRLVSADILNLIPHGVSRISVGKSAGNHCLPQEQINQTIVKLAQSGRRVVRLKGGDPYIFGRGGEEALALRRTLRPVWGPFKRVIDRLESRADLALIVLGRAVTQVPLECHVCGRRLHIA